MSNIYSINLVDLIPDDNDFTITVSASTYTFQCRFVWDTAIEEQYDELVREIAMLSATDPIGTSLIRDYSWPEYYLQFDGMSDAEIEERLNEIEIPASLKGLTTYQKCVIIKERLTQSLAYAEQLLAYEEGLKWQVIVNQGGEATVGFVQLGGWYNYSEVTSFRFVSEGRNVIGADDLQYVQMEFMIDE